MSEQTGKAASPKKRRGDTSTSPVLPSVHWQDAGAKRLAKSQATRQEDAGSVTGVSVPERANEMPERKKRGRALTALVRWLHIYVSVLGFLALLFFAVTGFTLNHAEWFGRGQEQFRQMQGSIEPALLGGQTAGVSGVETEFAAPAVMVEEAAAPPVGMGTPFEEAAAPPAGMGAPFEEAAAPAEPMGFPPEELRFPAVDRAAPVADAGGVDKLAVVETLRSRHSLKGAVAEFAVDEFQCFVSFRGPGYSADTFIDRATGRYELTEARPGWVALLNDLHTGRAAGPVWPWMIDLSALIMAVASITGLALVLMVKRRRLSGIVTAVVGSLVVVVVYLLWVP